MEENKYANTNSHEELTRTAQSDVFINNTPNMFI